VLLCRAAACLLILFVVLPLTAAAATPGSVHRGLIEVEGKKVPLPPGEWRLTGAGTSSAERNIVSLALLRLDGAAANAAVLIQTNRHLVAVDWGNPAACGRSDLYFADIRYATDHDNSCAYAAYVASGPQVDAPIDPAWWETVQRAAQSGWALPGRWIVAGFSLGDRKEGLAVRYFFASPPALPIPQATDALAAWTRLAWDGVARGFRNRRGDAAPAALSEFRPAPADPPPAPPPQAAAGGETSELGRIGLKTLTFRIVATGIDFTQNLLFVGDAALAAAMSGVAVVLGPIVFFLHELAWTYAETPRQHVLGLPGIGAEGPDPAAGRGKPG
jgi:uncharacterized membrane protein